MIEVKVSIPDTEILMSKLSMMGILKSLGLPVKFVGVDKDWECDWDVIDGIASWYDAKTNTHYYKWRYRNDVKRVDRVCSESIYT